MGLPGRPKAAGALARRMACVRPSFIDQYHHLHLGPYLPGGPETAIGQRFLQKWRDKPRTGLWWAATTNLAVSSKSVVRNKGRNRVRVVWKELLAQQGFDAHGLPLPGLRPRALRGTLRLTCLPDLVVASRQELAQELTLVLRHILGRNKLPELPLPASAPRLL